MSIYYYVPLLILMTLESGDVLKYFEALLCTYIKLDVFRLVLRQAGELWTLKIFQ